MSSPPPNFEDSSRESNADRLVLLVSSFDRPDYLGRLVSSFAATRSKEHDWTVVIADDGSAGGCAQASELLRANDIPFIVLRHGGWRIAALTNSLLDVGFGLEADVAFKVDDDVEFTQSGWDDAYMSGIASSGFGHLVFHDPHWPAAKEFPSGPVKVSECGNLQTRCAARDAQGAFFTVTRKVFDTVGYLDERSFWGRGFAHIDYTLRCCSAGHNERASLWDAVCSERFLTLGGRSGYKSSVDWDSPEVAMATTERQRARRERVMQSRRTPHLGFGAARKLRKPPDLIAFDGISREMVNRLVSRGIIQQQVDAGLLGIGAYVLNLRSDREKWTKTASQISSVGLKFERLPAHDGRATPLLEEWNAYAVRGLETPLDQALGRRAIESPGAWGYLSSARQLLRRAVVRRHEAVLILDDDVLLAQDFVDRLVRGRQELPYEWHVLYLGWNPQRSTDLAHYSPELVASEGQCNGSFGMLLAAQFIHMVLDATRRMDQPFDEAIRSLDAAHPGRGFALRKPCVLPQVRSSGIRAGRNQILYTAGGNWDWLDFASRMCRPDFGGKSAGHPRVLWIYRVGLGSELQVLAERLSSVDRPDLVVVWELVDVPRARSNIEALMSMDPRFIEAPARFTQRRKSESLLRGEGRDRLGDFSWGANVPLAAEEIRELGYLIGPEDASLSSLATTLARELSSSSPQRSREAPFYRLPRELNLASVEIVSGDPRRRHRVRPEPTRRFGVK